MYKWTVQEVCEWAKQKELPSASISIFTEHNIDGEQLANCTDAELSQIISNKGLRGYVIYERDSHLESEQSMVFVSNESETDQTKDNVQPSCTEPFRKFDAPVDILDKYQELSSFPPSDPRPTDLISPVRYFIPFAKNLSTPSDLEEVMPEIINFSTACLNDRTNGVIYLGVENGKIFGVQTEMSQSVLEKQLSFHLKKAFSEDQLEVVFKCIRPFRIIEVVPRREFRKYVLEVEVVPSSLWCENRTFTCHRLGAEYIYRFGDNGPYALQHKEYSRFFAETKFKIIQERKWKEQNKPMKISFPPKLKEKLVHALCMGDDKFLGDRYPFLVISPIDDNVDPSQFSFIKDIPWKSVLDFGHDGAIYNYLQSKGEVFSIKQTEDFDPDFEYNRKNPEHLKKLTDAVKTSQLRTWVFANGYKNIGTAPLPLHAWKQKRKHGMRQYISSHLKSFNNPRMFVVYLLLSKEFEIMVEGADEFCADLGDTNQYSYVCICEDKKLELSWRENLLSRKCIKGEILEEQTVAGLPWQYVCETIAEITDNEPHYDYKVRTNYGTKILPAKKKNEWNTLDIVCSNHCQNEELTSDVQRYKQFRTQVKEKFYRGCPPDWWNFKLQDAIKREIHEKLMEKIQDSLRAADFDNLNAHSEGALQIVTLYHQPGAGGTTCAKQVLWDLRTKYKAAQVLTVNDNTCEQIAAFHEFGENPDTEPGPVLLLLDNLDAERKTSLLAQLREKSQRRRRHVENENPYCVCLLVEQKTKLQQSYSTNQTRLERVYLPQKLTPNEQGLFADNIPNIRSAGLNPDKMLAYNIMKDNFDPESIRQTASHYVGNIKLDREKFLLQYLAFLDYYDANRKIPNLSGFDSLMCQDTLWETKLSSEIDVLVNVQEGHEGGKTISISHTTLSKEILHILTEGMLLSKFTCTFLKSSPFKDNRHSSKVLREHLGSMLITREIGEDGKRVDFPKLVEEIIDKEDKEAAANTLIFAFDVLAGKVSNHVETGLAQQTARVFIRAKDWKQAEYHADRAIDVSGRGNFTTIDTKGQVYRGKLEQLYQQMCSESEVPYAMRVKDVLEAVKTGQTGMDIFQREQYLAYKAPIPAVTGHVGILQIGLLSMKCLSLHPVFRERHNSGARRNKQVSEKLHRFIVDKEFVVDELKDWANLDGIDYLQYLKDLYDNISNSLRGFDEYYAQLVPSYPLQAATEMEFSYMIIHVVNNLKQEIDFFTAEKVHMPKKDAKQKMFRFTFAGTTLVSLLDEGKKEDGKEHLLAIQEQSHVEYLQDLENMEVLLLLFDVTLALWILYPESEEVRMKFTFDNLAEWSNNLYAMRSVKRSILEPYLYFVMFNWPGSDDAPKQELVTNAQLKWMDAFMDKYPSQQKEKDAKITLKMKSRRIFYFGKGERMSSIVHYSKIAQHNKDVKLYGESFWKDENIRQVLQRFTGTLVDYGEKVMVNDSTTGLPCIKIPAAYPSDNPLWWNKPITFVIAFTWSGPKANDIMLED